MLLPISSTFRKLLGTSLLSLAIGTGLCASARSAAAQSTPPTFSQIIVFGDSLSDTGNVRDRTRSKSGGTVDYPSNTFNYSDGRFTNSSSTTPASTAFVGVWHEQFARNFLNVQEARFSLGGGTDYAFGGATTNDGTTDIVATSVPGFGDVTITIDNMGRQVDNYLAARVVDPNALYVVWGGGNDLFNDNSASNVTATASRATALVSRLAKAGAKYIMVPNVPPLGATPRFAGDATKSPAFNRASADYRHELAADLAAGISALAAQGLTPTVYQLDIWTNTIRLFADPLKYGFANTRDSAQDASVNPDRYLFWDDIHPTTAGHFQTARAANDTLAVPQVPFAKAVNIATRAGVDLGERTAIAGFIITGDAPKKVLIRGIGPSLTASNVPGVLADPMLTLVDSASNAPMGSNDNWKDTQQAEITATGIAPKNDLESAILVTLPAGRYTAQLTGKNNGTGNGLIEVYDLEPASNSMLGNVSTRAFVGTGDNALIGGVIVGQGDSPMLVFRAIGPTLANFGVVNPLLDPTMELRTVDGTLLASDDNWRENPSQVQGIRASQLAPTNDKESAIIVFLPPGNYTAIVRGKGDTTGVALVEAYRVQ